MEENKSFYKYVRSCPNRQFGIEFAPTGDDIFIPQKYLDFNLEVEEFCRVLENLYFIPTDRKKIYYKEVLLLAQAGLIHMPEQLDVVLQYLESLKKELIVKEGARLKVNYMWKLFIHITWLTIFSLCLFTISAFVLRDNIDGYNLVNHYGFFISIVSSSFGLWISFGARKFKLEYEDLLLLEEDQMSPVLRIVFINVITFFIIVIIKSKVILISIGTLEIGSDMSYYQLSVVGFVLGLIESKVSVSLHSWASKIKPFD